VDERTRAGMVVPALQCATPIVAPLLLYGSEFIWLVTLELLGYRKCR